MQPFRPAMTIAGLWDGRLGGGHWSGLSRRVVGSLPEGSLLGLLLETAPSQDRPWRQTTASSTEHTLK